MTEIEALEDEIAKLKAVIARANNSLFGSFNFFLSLDGSEGTEHHLSDAIEDLKAEANDRYQEIVKLKDAAEIAKLEERLACSKIAAESSFGFPIEVWMKATKKEMTALVALSIAEAILKQET